ncbi:baseplate J/gp47 family protein [Cohnella thailandensis]|uniref:Baseplate J/gp47 family protein n=1 Tax=Cohnella thailandensis TaxID=557557 RepID=A0A841SVC2_9BACL|nr:baseplate J/gp47 family protein [Cohnella thailandensis]MBB6633567.1 baseplate J/gp47 family protein [Cohnella thailandensis]MBP1974585.1 putative phage protein gp47/JayE [Cohnella thailandensis]
MYEAQTYETILQRMLARVPNDIDKREGSVIFDALAPAALELAQMYAEIDINYNLSFADTASGEFLTRRTAEHGTIRKAATAAKRLGLFYDASHALMDVAVGTRFSISGVNYAVSSRLSLGKYELTCESTGVIGNQYFGPLLPIDYVEGLARGELADVRIPGADEETDESLRARFLTEINAQPFGGNVGDYLQKVGDLNGVGGVKVFPAWAGGGTVKLTILDSNYAAPPSALVNEVQTVMDPVVNSGEGIGMAPIGHRVTVVGAAPVTVNVSTTVTLQSGFTIGQVRESLEAAVEEYLLSLRKSWSSVDQTIVRISPMEARMLGVEGIADVSGTTLNGSAANITLTNEQIPMPGTVTLLE